MRRVEISRYGGPEVLVVNDAAPLPEPGPGRVVVDVASAGVNPADAKLRSGAFGRDTEPPFGAGFDAAGTVRAVGEGVTGVAIGDVVFGSAEGGAYADQAELSAWQRLPEGVDPVEAGGWPTPVATAVRVLDLLALAPGATLVVSGASGGVGTALVQLAVARGLVVIATAGAANQDYLRDLGARPLVYGDALVERVRAAAPAGVDGAVDVSGAGVLAELVTLAGAAHVVTIADFEGAERLGVRTSSGNPDPAAAFAEAAALAGFRLPVARTFPLDRAAAAQEQAASGHNRGKNVIVP